MRIQTILTILCLPLLLIGCGPSDEELIREAEKQVLFFIDELNMQNFDSAREIYPDLKKVTRYNIPKNFKISSTRFSTDNKKEIKITGNYGKAEFSKPVQFTLERTKKGSWLIKRSKGLSSYYESSLFNILKSSGCLKNIESDAAIHQQCQKMEPKFETLVDNFKKNLENNISFEKNGSNLKNNYNISISGELMLRNNSNISIPGFAYDVYIIFYNRNGEPSHSSKYEFNSSPILANQFHQITVFSMDYHRDYKSYSAVVQITDDRFIRSYLSQQGSIDCSDLL
jgi:hypothetical protein